MFSSQDWQIKLVYAGFGFLFAVIGMLLSPVTALRDKFVVVEFTELRVVDANGKTNVTLTIDEHGGVVVAFGKDGNLGASFSVDERGGIVAAFGKDEESLATLAIR
jgi:hypothetical protein